MVGTYENNTINKEQLNIKEHYRIIFSLGFYILILKIRFRKGW